MTRGERNIAFIERYCRVPEGKKGLVGKPLVLDDFQKDFIIDVYDNPVGTEKAILSMARKNGKTALIACLVLCHVVGPEAEQNSQIVSGARSRNQAALIFKLAVKMIKLNPALDGIIKIIPSKKMLVGLTMNVEYEALSADAFTTHGLSPILAIIDEAGQVRGPQDDFIDAVETAQGAYDNPLMIVISTQAPTDADLLSVWIDDAKKSNDPKIVCHVHEAVSPERYAEVRGKDGYADNQLLDPKCWREANPALDTFRSMDDLLKLATKASRMPSFENTFRNLNLNQRVSTVCNLVSRSVWDSCSGPPAPLYPGTWVWAGVDLSARTDLTAMLVVFKGGDQLWHVHPFFWTPEDGLVERAKRDRNPYDVWVRQGLIKTTPGRTVDYSFVAADIAEILKELTIKAIAYDRWRIEDLKKEFAAIGFDLADPSDPTGETSLLVEHGQGFKDMGPSVDHIESELLNGRILHGGHPVLRMCAANAVVSKDAAGNRKLDKAKSTGRIDGFVALTMAIGKAMSQQVDDGGSVYETGGVFSV